MPGTSSAAQALTSRWLRAPAALRRIDLPVGGLVVVLAGTAWFLLHQGRGTVFFFDEWNVWAGRYGGNPDKWLGPINGHLCAVPILATTAVTKIFGAETLTPFRVAGVASHLILLTLLFVVARRRVGGALALAAVLPLSVVAAGWLVLLMPFTTLFAIGPLIAALGAYLCLEREDRAGDVAACVLLALGMATSAGGLAVLAGFGVYVIVAPDRWRRLWVPGVPAVLYVIWRVAYDVPSEFAVSDLSLIVSYVVRGLSSGAGAYTTLGPEYGRILAVGLLVVAVVVLWRRARPGHAVATFVAIGGAYWALIAVARGPELGPEEVRYVYVNAALFVFFALSLIATPPVISARQPLMVGGLAVLVFLAQVQGYRQQAASYRETSSVAKADLFAFNTAAEVVEYGFVAPGGDPINSAGQYLNARRFWGGPPGYSEREIRTASAKIRDHVDTSLSQAFRLATVPVPSLGGLPLAALERPVVAGDGLLRSVSSRCWATVPAREGAAVSADVLVPPQSMGGIAIAAGDSPVHVLSGRYFDEPADDLGSVAPRTSATLPVTPDDALAPWTFRLTSKASTRVCGLER